MASNCLRLAVGLAVITLSTSSAEHNSQDCQKELTGLILSALALTGLICSYSKFYKLMVFFAALMYLWAIAIVLFACIFMTITDLNYDGNSYYLDVSNMVQRSFFRERNWKPFKTCLIKQEICSRKDIDVDVEQNIIEVFMDA